MITMNKNKYNEGDRVRIKGRKWFIDNKNRLFECQHFRNNFDTLLKFSGKIVTIDAYIGFDDYFIVEDCQEVIWDGDMFYGVVDENAKEYPQTYMECYEILDGEQREKTDSIIVNEYRKLINARNAYWKIYGEEKGLNKPWSPDWNGELYYLYYNPTNKTKIVKGHTPNGLLAYATLVFPTEEMADAFYDNFKEEIEICKELL